MKEKGVLCVILLVLFSVAFVHAEVGLKCLTVEGRTTPMGIDVAQPRFGWQIESDKKNVRQKSYRLLVASSRENLLQNIGDVWDSKEVRSAASQWVGSGQLSLLPNKEYYWKVAVKTNRGSSGWSEVQQWSTGLMHPRHWRGEWIGRDTLDRSAGDTDSRHSRLATRYLRKTFAARGAVRRATVHVCGLGLYTLYINGCRVGQDVLTPAPTDYTRSVIYNTYDVTSLLGRNNAVGVMLAGGHYFAQTQNYQTNVRTTYGYPKLLLNLIIEYADGKTETIATDRTWKLSTDGPIRYANGYDGELYDARKAFSDWAQAYFDDSRWATPDAVAAPGGALTGNLTPPMRVYETARPVSIRRYGNRYIVDFGTNGAGRVRLNVEGAAGDTVRIRHAELLGRGDSVLYTDNLRSAEATAWYVSDGLRRWWAPEFTYYGFRYAEISGAGRLTEKDIVRELIADEMDDRHTGFVVEEAGGGSILNGILANARRGIRSNYKGMPIDCPQRDERMPWLGDRTTGCLGESYLMNNHALYSKWVKDIRECQRPDGSISDVAPAYWRLYNGNITWPAALPFAADMLYRQYGDVEPMRQSYEAVRRFLAYARQKGYRNGLMTYDRYGDWCVPPESPKVVVSKDPRRNTDGRLIASVYYYYLCRLMQRYAGLFGHADDEQLFGAEASAMAVAVCDSLLTDAGFGNGTVTANLLPAAAGLAPSGRMAQLTDSIVATLMSGNGGHLSCGVVGIQWLMRYLSEHGRGDVAYHLAAQDTYPSWGYMLKKGATTIWELWNGYTANPSMNSGNHVMLLGDLLPWCYEYLAGIRPAAPGFSRILLKPDFSVQRIARVEGSHPSPYGVIRSRWQRAADGTITWHIVVPANTSAEVHLPDGRVKTVGSGDYTFITTTKTR